MRNFCVVCSLAVALCLVVCVSGNAKVTQAEATTAVADGKASVITVCARAQNQLNNATSVLEKVESAKRDATQASSQASETAKDNAAAEAIANTIKSWSNAVDSSYEEVKQNLKNTISSLTPLLAKAKDLENEPEITLPPNKEQEEDFTATHGKATDLKKRAEELDGQITTALQQMDELYSKTNDMDKKAKYAQIGYSQVSTIVDVAKIKTIMGEAESFMQTIQTKKTEVNGIVEEMKNLKATASSGSIDSIDKLYKKAEAELTKATSALDRAETGNEAINQQKELAETALKNFAKTNIDLTEAKQEANKAKLYITNTEENVEQLKIEEKIAETSATNAKNFKAELEQALLNAKNKPITEQGKETTNVNLPVVDGTESDQKDTTIQPTSKELPDQSGKSAEKLKETLINGVQNVPTTALTGGKAPAPGAKNDSAMTVSVPMLVALIASAVLH